MGRDFVRLLRSLHSSSANHETNYSTTTSALVKRPGVSTKYLIFIHSFSHVLFLWDETWAAALGGLEIHHTFYQSQKVLLAP